MKKCNFRMSQFVVHIKIRNEPLSLNTKYHCKNGIVEKAKYWTLNI